MAGARQDGIAVATGWLQVVLGAEPAGKPGPNDPNTVMFRNKQRQEFAELRDYLLEVVAANRQHGIDPSTMDYDWPGPTKAELAEAKLAATREAVGAASAEAREVASKLKQELKSNWDAARERRRDAEAEKFRAKAAKDGITRPDILEAGAAMFSRFGSTRGNWRG